MSEITQVLSQMDAGDPSAAERLLPLVYDELRKLAAVRLATERPDHTLQATALVHEAYVRLVDTETAQRWNSRGHFFSAAAEAMRRILIDSARKKQSLKRGGRSARVPLDEALAISTEEDHEALLYFNDALELLAHEDPQAAELVKLRLFAGLNVAESARIAGIPKSTAYDAWDFVRAWFAQKLPPDA